MAKTVDVDAYRKWISAGAQSVLWLAFALPCLLMLRDSLVAGPTWYTDYGLYGQQWGATQVFSKIVLRSTTSPNDTYYISSTWANGTDIYLPYFVPALADTGRVRMGNVRDLFTRKQQLTTDMVWVVTSDDVVAVRSSGRFKTILVDDLISYPNGEAGFSFLRLQYIDNLEELIARDRELRLALRTGRVIVGGQTLQVRHTALDAGGLGDIFDGNARTLGRFNGGNPAVLEFAFASPVPISNLSLAMTAGNWSVLARLVSTGGAQIEVNRVIDARTDPIVSLDIEPMTVASARIELRLQTAGDEAIVHLRDVTWS